jgi:hypothetical protein
MIMALAAVLLLALPSAAASSREDVNFNFGWTHRYGLHKEPPLAPPAPTPPPTPCSPTTFKFNASSLGCDGLTKNAAGDKAASDCEKACCAQTSCDIWQWSTGALPAAGCWMGHASCGSPDKQHANWVGGARSDPAGGGGHHGGGGESGPPGANPPEAQPGFDAAAWEKIATPHDSVMSDGVRGAVANKELCSSGCSGRSYLPRRESWYRKEFTLPADYSGSSVWLWFEGVFRDSCEWLQ